MVEVTTFYVHKADPAPTLELEVEPAPIPEPEVETVPKKHELLKFQYNSSVGPLTQV
jgi:hypothetical protein